MRIHATRLPRVHDPHPQCLPVGRLPGIERNDLARDRNGLRHLFIAPITTKEPPSDRVAVLIPETEARRAKLDTDVRLWVIVGEVNYDILEQSYTLEDHVPRGRFSHVFVEHLAHIIKKIHSERTLGIAKRN